jgi:hypothetical protein
MGLNFGFWSVLGVGGGAINNTKLRCFVFFKFFKNGLVVLDTDICQRQNLKTLA